MQLSIIVRTTFFLIVSILASCNQNSTKNISINGEEAIEKAEQFIIQQGYTNLPAHLPSIKFEQGEFASDTAKILAYRKNILEKKAFAAKQHGSSWTVGFMYINKENNIGRAVTMDTLAVNTIMQPKEVRLDWFYEEDNNSTTQ